MSDAKHPVQPVIVASDGVHRFKKNAIVERLLEAGPFDLNAIARMGFSREDHEQLAQLIGYSVCGFCDLSYASEETKDASMAASEALAGRSTSTSESTHDRPRGGVVAWVDAWEYMPQTVWGGQMQDVIGMARSMGTDGWELCATDRPPGEPRVDCYFKRRVPR